MRKEEKEEPIYDSKVKEALEMLGEGKSREKVADEMGYSSYKGLDQYLRRRNFVYDADQRNYVPEVSKRPKKTPGADAEDAKVEMVLNLLEENGHDEPREVARRAGFSDHLKLAEFMDDRGYRWDEERGTYVRDGRNFSVEDSDPDNSEKPESEKESFSVEDIELEDLSGSDLILRLGRYLPLLELLEDREEELRQLLDDESEKLKQPGKYSLRGEAINKNVYMSRLMALLLEEFSDLHGMAQREVVESALVEYFRRYDFEGRVMDIMNCS